MKKIIITFMAITLAIGILSGCSADQQQKTPAKATQITTQAAEAQTGEIKTNDETKASGNEVREDDVNTPTAKEAPVWADVSQEEAKKIALKDAGVKASKAKNMIVNIGMNDETLIYNVSFNAGKKKYDYIINAANGKIIEKEID